MIKINHLLLTMLCFFGICTASLGQSSVSIGFNLLNISPNDRYSYLDLPLLAVYPINGIYANYETDHGWQYRVSVLGRQDRVNFDNSTTGTYGYREETAASVGVGKNISSGKLATYLAVDFRYADIEYLVTIVDEQQGIVIDRIRDDRVTLGLSPTVGLRYRLSERFTVRAEAAMHLQHSSITERSFFAQPSADATTERSLFSLGIAPISILGFEIVF